MTLSSKTLAIAFGAAGIAMLGLAFTVSLHARQVTTRVITEDVVNLPPGALPPGLGGPTAPMKPGTGIIVGQTMDAATSRPLSGALVTLTVPGTVPLRALSDSQGRFAFRDLPKGSFNVTATKGGYSDGAYGRLRPQGQAQPIQLDEGGRVSAATVPLFKFAAIGGQLVDEAGEPMVGASVRVLRKTIASGRPRLTMGRMDTTDDRGYYRISQLEAGEYIVAVPMNQQDALRMAIEDVARTGSGGVGTIMAATPIAAAGGGGTFTVSLDGSSGTASAGVGPDGRALSYPTMFYPMAASASKATPVLLGPGEDRNGLDFKLQAVRASRVSGSVISTAGPAGNLLLTLVPSEADGLVSPIETATTMSDASGNFTFATVVPGNYVIRASRTPRMAGGPSETIAFSSDGGSVQMMMTTRMVAGGAAPALPNEPTLWAEVPVSVGAEDVEGVPVPLRVGAKVSGQLEWSGSAERPAMDRLPSIRVTLEPVDQQTATNAGVVAGRVETSGAFATAGTVPGRYFVRAVGAPQGWYFKGATLNGRDVSDLPLDVAGADLAGVLLTFTDKQTELTGTVTTNDGAADPTASVIVFPAERDTWNEHGNSPRRLRNVRPDAKGAFSITGLPTGRYYVAATRESGAAEWQDPRFLDALSNGASIITLGDGQKASQSLKVVR